jgi:hypothetical protein
MPNSYLVVDFINGRRDFYSAKNTDNVGNSTVHRQVNNIRRFKKRNTHGISYFRYPSLAVPHILEHLLPFRRIILKIYVPDWPAGHTHREEYLRRLLCGVG